MTLSRGEQFEQQIGFRLVGDTLWTEKGVRKASPEEKALWQRCIGFIEEIDLLKPVQNDCPHEKRIVSRQKDSNGKPVWTKCVQCDEYLYYNKIHL